ncbi:hypothetical protein GCM10007170_40440 [Arthrobacter liuii]|uniref:Uncharacterized protein n=1 Tax=Arthrobacter liuii TaxID=1476996 RepID=A0ABQ2AXJ7_9MICC|nr:hypothetical protein GCM10007170_40440 [Arthrobacter liuii]
MRQPHLVAAREMKLHPTQFREVYGRINYMTKACWTDRTHPIVEGKDVITVLAGPWAEFSGSFVVDEFAQVMASLWEVPFEAIYRDGYSYSTLYDTDIKRSNPVYSHDVIFTAPHGDTGLWPAHQMDVRERYGEQEE